MRNTVNTAPKVTVLRNVEILSANVLGGCDILCHEKPINLLADLSSEMLHHWEHCGINFPSHTLQSVHAIDVLLHAAVTECALDRGLSSGMGIADECGRDTCAVVPVAARPPTGPILQGFGCGEEDGVAVNQFSAKPEG